MCSPRSCRSSSVNRFLIFHSEILREILWNFAGFCRTHKIEAQKVRGTFRSNFRKKIRCSKRAFCAKFALQTCHLKDMSSWHLAPFVHIHTLWHEIPTKEIPWKRFFFGILKRFCALEISRKEWLFQELRVKFVLFQKDWVVLVFGGLTKGCFGFQKGSFGGRFPGTKTGTRVHSDVPPERKPGTRVRSHVPPEWKPERGYVCQDHPFKKPFSI